MQADVVQRIDKAQIGEFFVLAANRRVGGFDVQVGDVVGQDGDFVGVQLMVVFMLEFGRLAAKVFEQFADRGTKPESTKFSELTEKPIRAALF